MFAITTKSLIEGMSIAGGGGVFENPPLCAKYTSADHSPNLLLRGIIIDSMQHD